MFTRNFWRQAAERAIKTAGQFGLTAWGVTAFTVVGDVVSTVQATGLAALFGAGLSLLTSIGSAKIGPEDSPSVVGD